ncbi:Sensory transduction protein regX3 [Eubacteriaceae bacterium CHKCI005]|nr:Sensory transduction protein regX3 [Eubacteriaceae bacterium CHKCI005]
MIYIVEDDASILGLEEYALQGSGFETKGFEDGESFLKACAEKVPQLVVLDVMLPGQDGISILEQIRKDARMRDVAVIMVTAKSSEIDVVKGLDHGADDYLAKPFGVMEFISRVKAVLRRSERREETVELLEFGPVRMDEGRHSVEVDGHAVELTYKEYTLLRLFLQNAEQVLTRETIMREVWDTDFSGESRTVDMHVRTLRQKLGDAGEFIRTVRKVGYQLSEKAEDA